jgi:hypothetical protein
MVSTTLITARSKLDPGSFQVNVFFQRVQRLVVTIA